MPLTFPTALTDPRAFDIAQKMLDGFDRHYLLFRRASADAKQRFEAADYRRERKCRPDRAL